MRVGIIGEGLLARHIFEVLRDDVRAEMLSHAYVDVTSPASVTKLEAFDVVVNTAAYHQLAACERHPERAEAVNAIGPRNVGKVAPQVFISTDYVFSDRGPHAEELPGVLPPSVYGKTKFAGEIATLETGGIVVRVAGLFGHYRSHKGPTFPQTILSSSDPIKLPRDQIFTPTYAVDAARRIAGLAVLLGAGGEEDGIYHATNKGGTSWAEFGNSILEIAREKRPITPYSAKDPLRPTDSQLISTRLPELRHWRQALVDWSIRRERERISPLREGWDQ